MLVKSEKALHGKEVLGINANNIPATKEDALNRLQSELSVALIG